MVRDEAGRRVSRAALHYSLPAILAVGYRVRSPRGTQFRQWATGVLFEYLVKGFAMDDARLRQPPGPGVPDHFDELLARIRDIRASERRMFETTPQNAAMHLRAIYADASSGRAQLVSNSYKFAGKERARCGGRCGCTREPIGGAATSS